MGGLFSRPVEDTPDSVNVYANLAHDDALDLAARMADHDYLRAYIATVGELPPRCVNWLATNTNGLQFLRDLNLPAECIQESTAVHVAQSGSARVLVLVLQHLKDHTGYVPGETLLRAVASKGEVDKMEACVRAGAKVSPACVNYAAMSGSPRMFTYCDNLCTKPRHKSVLLWALMGGNKNILYALRAQGHVPGDQELAMAHKINDKSLIAWVERTASGNVKSKPRTYILKRLAQIGRAHV